LVVAEVEQEEEEVSFLKAVDYTHPLSKATSLVLALLCF